jgi:hypothetical protein
MSTNTIKVYDLFPHRGGFSVKTVDYQGIKLTVSATSVRQAYALAYGDIWISPTDQRPVGIISICRRTTGTTLWCGCCGHDLAGRDIPHGAGITVLRNAIETHQCTRQMSSLRHRLLAAAAPTQKG